MKSTHYLTTLFIYRKILYINITEYNNIDTFTKLIRQCNNLNKSYILIKLIYIVHTYTHVHDIYNTRTRTYVRTRAYTYIYIHIYTKYIYILSIYCVKIALKYT